MWDASQLFPLGNGSEVFLCVYHTAFKTCSVSQYPRHFKTRLLNVQCNTLGSEQNNRHFVDIFQIIYFNGIVVIQLIHPVSLSIPIPKSIYINGNQCNLIIFPRFLLCVQNVIFCPGNGFTTNDKQLPEPKTTYFRDACICHRVSACSCKTINEEQTHSRETGQRACKSKWFPRSTETFNIIQTSRVLVYDKIKKVEWTFYTLYRYSNANNKNCFIIKYRPRYNAI